MRIYLMKTASKAFSARFYSTHNFKKVTHCIFDMDGLLLGEFRNRYNVGDNAFDLLDYCQCY